MGLFDALGFRWDRAAIPAGVPVHSVERACFRFHKMLAEFVWDAGVVEGTPLTFPEVMTLLDGVTVGGRKIADQAQILNLIVASRRLLSLVRGRRFALDKATAMAIHALFAPTEAPESGAPLLRRTFDEGLACLMRDVPSPFERAIAFFMFGALQQFFFDANKRTSRFMMNGMLMANGIDAISVPAASAQEFNEKMVQFYLTKDATEMMTFLVACHPDAERIRALRDSVADAGDGESGHSVPK